VTRLPFYGPDTTFGGGFDEACKEGRKIDYIFVKNKVEVLRHGILTDSWNGTCPSDHMPLLAEINL
jgi:endonuclease/exonuclease/phosphatase family metal-dependent hydrolase